VRVWKRAQDDAPNGAEDGRRRADSEPERHDGDNRECRRLDQLADGERSILAQLAQKLGASHGLLPVSADLSAFGAHVVEAPKAAKRLASRGCWIHPALDELARTHLDVEVDLGRDLFADRRSADQAQEAVCAPWGHQMLTSA
jgi:hypothetical protein